MEHATRMPLLIDFDYVEEESDEDRRGQDSSEDELDIILHGTPKQKRKLSRSLSRGSLELSSSEDDFEKDMERELNETVRRHEERYGSPKDKAGSSGMEVTAAGTSTTQPKTQSLAEQFYDDIYFDSDGSDSGEEGDAAKKQKKEKGKKQKDKNRIIPDDELMYDPNIDDENQKWVDRQRQKYRNQQAKKPPPGKPDANMDKDTGNTSEPQNSAKKSGPSTSSVPAQPKSDALLNCPACLTTLCIDCQRHELYHNQYRAMFVLNCTIIKSERLKYPVPKKSNKKWKRNRGNKRSRDEGEGSVERTVADGDSDELYFPVQCSECNTEVAVYDEDEVFHFFNVLTSLA